MKTLTARDSSILAYIAAANDIPANERKRLFGQLSSEAKEIAKAMIEIKERKSLPGRTRLRLSEPAQKTANALLAWA